MLPFALASTLAGCVPAGGGGMIASWYVVPRPEEPAPPRLKDEPEPLHPGIYIMLVNAGRRAGSWRIEGIAVNRPNGPSLLKGRDRQLDVGQMWLLEAKMMPYPPVQPCELPVRLYVRGRPEKRGPIGGNKMIVARVEIEEKLPSTLPHDWRNHGCDPNWPATPPTAR